MIFKKCETCVHSIDNNPTGELCDRSECMIPELPYWEPVGMVKAVKRGADTAQKFDQAKIPLDLVPPDALLEVAKGMQYGAKKYGRFNYRKPGFSHHRLCAAALRHINAHVRNEDIDSESGNSHLSHATAALMMLIQNIHDGNIEDDRYKGE